MQSESDVSLQQAHNDMVRSLLRALEGHAPGEGGHAERVAVYATAVGEKLGLEDQELLHLRRAAQLHDVGKVRVSSSILSKPQKLSDAEWDELKLHAILAESVLESLWYLTPALPSIRHHHERWDGEGYPDGLVGDKIPLGARIIAAAEAFDSMVHSAPFRSAASEAEALEELRRCRGTHFDPKVVEAFEEIVGLVQPVEAGA